MQPAGQEAITLDDFLSQTVSPSDCTDFCPPDGKRFSYTGKERRLSLRRRGEESEKLVYGSEASAKDSAGKIARIARNRISGFPDSKNYWRLKTEICSLCMPVACAEQITRRARMKRSKTFAGRQRVLYRSKSICT